MTRKILSIRIDHGHGDAEVRAMSRSIRGTQFTLRGSRKRSGLKDKAQVKEALLEGLVEILPPVAASG